MAVWQTANVGENGGLNGNEKRCVVARHRVVLDSRGDSIRLRRC